MDDTPKPIKNRWQVLGSCSVLHIIHDGMSNMLYVLLPVLAQQFGLSLSQVGMIRGAQSAATALFQIPVGLASEQVGERGLLALGTILMGSAFALAAMSSGFYTLLILLFFTGVGLAVQHPLCSSLVSRAYADGGRRGALGTYNFTGDVGKFAIAGSASLMIAAGFAWQIPAIGFGIMAVIAGLASFFVLKRIDIGSRSPLASSDQPNIAKGWGIEDRPGFISLCLIGIIDNSTRAAILTFVAFLMISKGISEQWAVQAIPAVIAGGMVGKLACGFLADRLGVIKTVILTELATSIGIVLIIFLPGISAFMVLPILGIVLNGTSSVLYGTIGDLVHANRQSRVFALFYTLSSIASVIAPLGYGLIGDVLNVQMALLISAFMVLLTLPFTLVLRTTVRRAEKTPASIIIR